MRLGVKIAAMAAAGTGLAFALLIATGLAEAMAAPTERTAEVVLPGLDRAAPPYRIALLSDIHFGNRTMQPARLARIVSAVNAVQPDLIVIAGDFVNGHDRRSTTELHEMIAPLSALKARDGVIATLGNHDHWTDPGAVSAALADSGIAVLSNTAVRRGPLAIVALDDGYSGQADIAPALAAARELGGVPVAVTHSPDIAPELPLAIGLVLAGHTHCGQIVLPLIGSLAPLFGKLVGDRHYFNPRYRCGVVRDPGRVVVVTAGLGSGSIPLRINAPPDWWLVTIRPR